MNNENKNLKLLEIMYSEMKEGFKRLDKKIDAVDAKVDAVDAKVDAVDAKVDAVDAKVDAVDAKVDAVDAKADAIDAKVNKTNIIIEHEIIPKLEALFDGYNLHTEQIKRIDTKIDIMQADIDHLTIKTLAHGDKIVDLTKRVK